MHWRGYAFDIQSCLLQGFFDGHYVLLEGPPEDGHNLEFLVILKKLLPMYDMRIVTCIHK